MKGIHYEHEWIFLDFIRVTVYKSDDSKRRAHESQKDETRDHHILTRMKMRILNPSQYFSLDFTFQPHAVTIPWITLGLTIGMYEISNF